MNQNKSRLLLTVVMCHMKDNKGNKLALYECFDIIRPYLKDMIDKHKARDEWKIQLVMRIIFVSSIEANEVHIMHTKNNNIEIMNGIETNDAINELFNSFLTRYQEELETKMK